MIANRIMMKIRTEAPVIVMDQMIADQFSLVTVLSSAEIARFSKIVQLYEKYYARYKAQVKHTVH